MLAQRKGSYLQLMAIKNKILSLAPRKGSYLHLKAINIGLFMGK